jgi:hypothetical protein
MAAPGTNYVLKKTHLIEHTSIFLNNLKSSECIKSDYFLEYVYCVAHFATLWTLLPRAIIEQ